MKRLAAILLRITISAGLLALLCRQHSLGTQIMPHLQAMAQHWPWVLAGLGCAGASLLLCALRWWIVLRPHVPDARLSEVCRATLVGSFFDIGSLGTFGSDAYRVVALGAARPGSHVKLGVSIMLDHAAGTLGLLVFFAIASLAALLQAQEHAPQIRQVIATGAAVLLGGAALMALGMFTLSPWFLHRYERYLPRCLEPLKLRMAEMQLSSRDSWRPVIASAAVSLPVLCCHFSIFYCGLRAVGGDAKLLPVLLAMPLVDMAAGVPVSVSGLGVREKIFETLMTLLTGVPAATSVAASLAGWLLTVAWGLLGGVAFVLGRRTNTES